LILALLHGTKKKRQGMSLEFRSTGIEVEDTYVSVRTHDISLLQFVLEGYEGLVNVTTVDPVKALLRISIVPDCVDEVKIILNALANEMDIKTVSTF
jgi:hypothetical protein